jgi:hypothetical protein
MPVKTRGNWFGDCGRDDHEGKSECPEKYFSFVLEIYFLFLNESQF